MTLKKNNLDREFVKKRILDHLARNEDLGLDRKARPEEYEVYRTAYLDELEDIVFPAELLDLKEERRRVEFIERNRLNVLYERFDDADLIEKDIYEAVQGDNRLSVPKGKFEEYKTVYFQLYKSQPKMSRSEIMDWEMVGTLAGFTLVV